MTEGICPGTISRSERGSRGFGYDAVFVPDRSDGRTFAEMSEEEKNILSHRGRALRNVVARLTSPSRLESQLVSDIAAAVSDAE